MVLPLPAQQPDEAAILRQIDHIAFDRFERVTSFTVTEQYAVYRGQDETHPVAQMTVHTTYRKDSGKSYEIVSESGPELIRRFGLRPLLNNEKNINLPANREHSWFTTANYEMHLQAGTRTVDGHLCLGVSMHPRRSAPNMIEGTLWIDAKDYSIVRIEGTATKPPSIFAGTTRMMRQYKSINGFAMAEHARAESISPVFGRTVVTIDYSSYQIQFQPVR